MSFEGKRALITGGSRGIGFAVARRLGRSGAEVAVCGRNAERLDRAVEALREEGVRAWGAACDVSDPAAVDRLAAAVRERWDRLDILVNNAGVNEPTPLDPPDDAAWERVLHSNLSSGYYVTSRMTPLLPEGGRVIFISSVTGRFGVPELSAYCAAKHGVIGLMRSAALELAPRKITVNAVCPGWVETDMARESMERTAKAVGQSYEETRRRFLEQVPLGEMIDPDEVAELVLFLCSPAARHITGQAYNLCGGAVMS
ncbi:MAG: 3-oxoacyl-ACP reductase [Acidobacteriota bacterium]